MLPAVACFIALAAAVGTLTTIFPLTEKSSLLATKWAWLLLPYGIAVLSALSFPGKSQALSPVVAGVAAAAVLGLLACINLRWRVMEEDRLRQLGGRSCGLPGSLIAMGFLAVAWVIQILTVCSMWLCAWWIQKNDAHHVPQSRA